MDATAAKRWIVVCDGETETYATRHAARAAAQVWRRHPGNVDIRRRGGYRNATGKVHIVDLWERV